MTTFTKAEREAMSVLAKSLPFEEAQRRFRARVYQAYYEEKFGGEPPGVARYAHPPSKAEPKPETIYITDWADDRRCDALKYNPSV